MIDLKLFKKMCLENKRTFKKDSSGKPMVIHKTGAIWGHGYMFTTCPIPQDEQKRAEDANENLAASIYGVFERARSKGKPVKIIGITRLGSIGSVESEWDTWLKVRLECGTVVYLEGSMLKAALSHKGTFVNRVELRCMKYEVLNPSAELAIFDGDNPLTVFTCSVKTELPDKAMVEVWLEG